MNKKLKIYTTLFLVVLIVLLVFPVNLHHYSSTYIPGSEGRLEYGNIPEQFYERDTIIEADGGISTSSKMSTRIYTVNVLPKKPYANTAIISTVGDQAYKVTMKQVTLALPTAKAKKTPTVIFITSIIISLAMLIWVLCLVIKLIRSIRRGEIFVSNVSKYLETTGILLSVIYIIQLISSYAEALFFMRNIKLAEYDVVFQNNTNSMLIITGLALMIISQIILMGKDLKDEQELTI